MGELEILINTTAETEWPSVRAIYYDNSKQSSESPNET
jgi:hypothetical protein